MSAPEAANRATSAIAVALLLAACSPQDGQPQRAVVADAAAVTPPPAPPPSPPPPAPTPPAPTPGAPAGPLIATVAPGGQLAGGMACTGSIFTLAQESGGRLRIVAVPPVSRVKIEDNRQTIAYLAADSYRLDANGFGGPSFTSADRRQSPSGGHDYFFGQASDELELYRGFQSHAARFATMGRYSEPNILCFFAAGPPTRNFLVDGDYGFRGIADGLLVKADGTNLRLYGSPVSATMRANRREVQISIALAARTQPFGAFLDSPALPLGQADALMTYAGPGMSGVLTGPDGSTGIISGEIYDGLLGLGLVFDLKFPNGDRAFGAIALDPDSS